MTRLEQLEARLKATQEAERALRKEAQKERRKMERAEAEAKHRAEVAEALELIAFSKTRMVRLDGEEMTIYDVLRRELDERNRATGAGA